MSKTKEKKTFMERPALMPFVLGALGAILGSTVSKVVSSSAHPDPETSIQTMSEQAQSHCEETLTNKARKNFLKSLEDNVITNDNKLTSPHQEAPLPSKQDIQDCTTNRIQTETVAILKNHKIITEKLPIASALVGFLGLSFFGAAIGFSNRSDRQESEAKRNADNTPKP